MSSPIRVATDERGVITGATGTGKTTFVKRLLLPAVPAHHTVIIVDPKCDAAWRDIPSMQHTMFGMNIKRGARQAFRFGDVSDDSRDDGLGKQTAFIRLLRAVWEHRDILLINDETGALYPDEHSMTPLMGRLIREGRQRDIGIWWLTQRPSKIPMSIVTESEWAAVFTLRYRADRKKMAETFGDECEQLPPQEEGRSHFFYWARLPNKPRLQRLRLGGDTTQAA